MFTLANLLQLNKSFSFGLGNQEPVVYTPGPVTSVLFSVRTESCGGSQTWIEFQQGLQLKGADPSFLHCNTKENNVSP